MCVVLCVVCFEGMLGLSKLGFWISFFSSYCFLASVLYTCFSMIKDREKTKKQKHKKQKQKQKARTQLSIEGGEGWLTMKLKGGISPP